MQNFTSASTSINSAKLPAIYRKISISAPLVFDYGCGKYTEHIRSAFPEIEYLPYDPYNQPKEVNRHSVWRLGRALQKYEHVTIICSNVLNVIDDDTTIKSIAEFTERVVTKTCGVAYFTVYEGDRSGNGRQTGKDQYQRNEPLRNYLRFFKCAHIRNGMIVVGA